MSIFRATFMTAYRSRLYPNYWDMLAFLIVLSVISLFAWNAKQMATPYELGQVLKISLSPSALPFYAARTVFRMLIAMLFSLLFTFVFATWAAKSHRAGKIIIPLIDVLQSVPILGFLSVTVTAFIAIFPGSMIGPECAAIFAIFTSQAWNMAFGFYQAIRAVPADVNEAAKILHLSAWHRFWRIDVPFAMPGLLWNMMASMSAGWFFVVASEAITVSNQSILLPGIGSYIAVAIGEANLWAITYAVLTMFVVIIIYDQLLFRPLVAWSEKFKSDREGVGAETAEAESWVIDLFRRTRVLRKLGNKIAHLFSLFAGLRIIPPQNIDVTRGYEESTKQRQNLISWFWNAILLLICIAAILFLINYVGHNISLKEIAYVFFLGLITALRVFILIVLCSLLWVPVGIWIGLRPRMTQIAQPVAQILAAFPANLFYPFIVLFIVYFHLSPNIWLSPLMILGAQWYILFNVVAGAAAIPKDLIQAADNLGVVGKLRWMRLLLPGIFPFYITGAITAAGGAWNASIVAEIASWGNEKLVATGLGAYIAQYTAAGNFARTALGIGMMCLFVIVINRLVWRPLYIYAEDRFLWE